MRDMYLQHVAEEITELQRRPAHRWQSAEDSSLDAWFEGTRTIARRSAASVTTTRARFSASCLICVFGR